jgi:hypothetical protein
MIGDTAEGAVAALRGIMETGLGNVAWVQWRQGEHEECEYRYGRTFLKDDFQSALNLIFSL